MKWLRLSAWVFLGGLLAVSLLADVIAPYSYSEQSREAISAPPSGQHILGTDELGRDRFSRLLYGTRISLLLAPAAALVSTLIAAILGTLAGYLGGVCEWFAKALIDLSLSLPWLFLLLTVRAMLPLNTPPITSILITFALMALLGWATAARVINAGVANLRRSDFLLLARANGTRPLRLLTRHALPNLKPVLLAQFWISVPLFLLTEANLGLLGLGVSEPLPSWGNLLRELGDVSMVSANPWMLTPAVLLLVVVSGFHLILREGETPS